MDEILLMTSLAMFLLLAAVCSIVFNKIKLPPLIGYLMAGILIANFYSINEMGKSVVEILSDMGLIMLMFSIGLEINLKKLRKQGLFAIEVALVQLPLMVLGGVIAGGMLGFNMLQSICLGGIISGSSTAVIMAVLKTQNRLDKEHIETLVLITIMEDIGQVIILSMITPMLAGTELDAGGLAAMVVSIMAFMIVSVVIGLRFMPRIVNWVADNVTSEVVVILAVGLAFGMAFLANFVGLSVAIGAFLMGMMIASSRKSGEIAHDIEPMKNIFMAMFFISVGMEISLDTLASNIGLIAIIYIVYATLKSSTVFLGYWIGGEDSRLGFVSAIGLCAMGEFAFIIAKQALDHNVVDNAFYTSVVGAALVSMIVLPILSGSSVKIWESAQNKCPAGVMAGFSRINSLRDTFYQRMAESSKKTRKELRTTMNKSYFSVTIAIIIEIIFILITPPIRDWASEYFGGEPIIWSFVLLVFNLFALYPPLYELFANLKVIQRLASMDSVKIQRGVGGKLALQSRFYLTNTLLLALMTDMTILIIIPNDIGFWEHFIVLGIALVVLLLMNRKMFRKKDESAMGEGEDLMPYDVSESDFMQEMNRKIDIRKSEEEKNTVRIDVREEQDRKGPF